MEARNQSAHPVGVVRLSRSNVQHSGRGRREDNTIKRMDNEHSPTVERSLDALSEALGKASEDLSAVRTAIDQARADIASRNTSISREVIGSAERAIERLRDVDEALRETLKLVAERD